MRMGILHASFEVAGGGEKFALELYRALEELSHDVELITFHRDLRELRRALNLLAPGRKFNIIANPVPLSYRVLDLLNPGRFVRLKRLLLIKASQKYLRKDLGYDVLFETISNVPLDVDVSYIHYPAIAEIVRKTRGGLLYDLYQIIVEYYVRSVKGSPRLVLTNSSWTAKEVLMSYPWLRGKVHVLHPPVDVEYFNEVSSTSKENIVITVSRYTPEKKLIKILEVAKGLRDYRFVIAGSTGRYSQPVISQLRSRIEGNDLDNVKLLINVPRDRLRELLSKARFYLHPPFPEHFGISVVEAMSAGCVPIVYRDGGAWVDVVSKISDMLGYSDVNEVPSIIRRIDAERELYEELREKSINHSKQFNYERFKSEVSKWVNYLQRAKASLS